MIINKLVIVHFNSIEKFPPLINLLRYLSSVIVPKDLEIEVYTTTYRSISWIGTIANVTVKRFNYFERGSKIFRMLGYFIFNTNVLVRLIHNRPGAIMYFETLSAWPVIIYKRYFNKHVRVFIHYHEYSSLIEYENGMLLNRLYHRAERNIYPNVEWISHTNPSRLKMFCDDEKIANKSVLHVLPNYPPLAWATNARVATAVKVDNAIAGQSLLRLIYIGALSIETTYFLEMADFVSNNPVFCEWDIYSANYSDSVRKYLDQNHVSNIRFRGQISYDQIPGLLLNYDVGVILYKADTLNFQFNAPNKYFEYNICGLNVIYPREMSGMVEYENSEMKPWTRKVDFQNLADSDFRDGKRLDESVQPILYAEKVYQELAETILITNEVP